MKISILSSSAFALLYALPTMAQTCVQAPSCANLGYTQSVSECVGKYLTCPFDTSKVVCLTTAPKVGDLKYSLQSANHDGWIKCDGQEYSQSTYSKLYAVIGTKFCHIYTSRTDVSTSNNGCSSGKFAVPDYRGFFLRGVAETVAAATPGTAHTTNSLFSIALSYKGGTVNQSIFAPQQEELPNITGEFGINAKGADLGWNSAVTAANNAFYRKDGIGDGGNSKSTAIGGVGFSAQLSNTIYDGSHVIPANYGAYIFIYAGR